MCPRAARAARSRRRRRDRGCRRHAAPITGRPRQNASITTRPRPSERDGRTSAQASSSAAATPSGASTASSVVRSGSLGDEPLDDVGERPTADEARSVASGNAGRGGAPCVARARRRSCTARARRRRAPPARRRTGAAGPANGSRSMNAGKTPRRLDAELAHEAGRVAGDRADAVRAPGAPSARRGRRAARARDGAASRRAASRSASPRARRARAARGCARAARATRTAAASYALCATTASGPEAAQLAGDAHRQRERGTRRRRARAAGAAATSVNVPSRVGEPGAALPSTRTSRSRAERVPLLAQARVERQPVARPAHEEDARPQRLRATRASVASSSPKTRSGAYAATDGAAAARSRARSSSSPK